MQGSRQEEHRTDRLEPRSCDRPLHSAAAGCCCRWLLLPLLLLSHHMQDRAVRYLFEHLDQLAMWGDILQMAVLELIRKVCECVGGGLWGGSDL